MLELPNTRTLALLTDWVEASLITASPVEGNRLSDTTVSDVLQEGDVPDCETVVGGIARIVERRRSIVGPDYPFRRSGLGFSLARTREQSLPYYFLLLVSLNQGYVALSFGRGQATRPAEYFENIAGIALSRYLRCRVIRLGAPRRLPIPAAFPSALDYATTQLGEAIGQRDLEDQTSGDDGVDLIGWLPFDDDRAGQTLFFGQCAIGTDWRDKRDAINSDMWRRHIDWHATPLRGFAVPFHHEPGGPWRESSARAGIVFDRLRIAKLTPARFVVDPLRQQIQDWCDARTAVVSALRI